MHKESFSQRRGLEPTDIPITIRNETPNWLRDFIVTEALNAGMSPSQLRDIICTILLESPDSGNWSAGNIECEVRCLLARTEWFYVYNFIEEVAFWVHRYCPAEKFVAFSRKLNDALIRKGVGWQLVNDTIETRGEEAFETSVRTAISMAKEMKKKVAAKELHEALLDLSKRPEPDSSGAIQHAMGALECIARDVTGDVNATLGALLKKHPDTLPPPLDDALSKIWGFASDHARHLRENQPPAIEEARLIVGLSGALTTYLLMKFNISKTRLE